MSDLRKFSEKVSIPLSALLFTGFAAYLLICLYKLIRIDGDFIVHLAEVRTIYDDMFRVHHESMVGADAGALFYTPYHLLWAAIGKALGVTPYVALQLAGVVNILLLILSAIYFVGTFIQGPTKYLAAAFFLLLSVLFRTKVYTWSSEVALDTLVNITPYPSILARSMALFFWAAMERRIQKRSAPHPALLAPLFTFLLISHPVTATWVALMVAMRAVLLKDRVQAGQLVAPIVVGIMLSLLWPQVSFLNRAIASPYEHSPYARMPFRHIWPLYLIFAGAMAAGYARRYPFFVVGFLATGFVFSVSALLHVERFARYLFFLEIFPQLVLTLFVFEGLIRNDLSRRAQLVRLGVFGFLLAGCIFLHGGENSTAKDLASLSPAHTRMNLAGESWRTVIKKEDITLVSSPYLANEIFLHTGARTVVGVNSDFVIGGAQRRLEKESFFSGKSSDSQGKEFLAKFHVTRVVVEETVGFENIQSIRKLLGEPVAKLPGVMIFDVKPL